MRTNTFREEAIANHKEEGYKNTSKVEPVSILAHQTHCSDSLLLQRFPNFFVRGPHQLLHKSPRAGRLS